MSTVLDEFMPSSPKARRPKVKKSGRPSIIEFMEDRKNFGTVFASSDWDRWKILLRAMYGLPLDTDEAAFFCTVTGRSTYDPPENGWREVVIITGARSGKSSIAAALADYEAVYPLKMPPIGFAWSILVAQDQRSALRTLLGYARAPFETQGPLKSMVTADVNDVLSLNTRVKLGAYPCRPASIRGLTAVTCVADEFAFFIGTEQSATDLEMLRAMRSRVATTGGRVVILSSPYGESGALWDLRERHYGKDGSPTLVIQTTAPMLNPTLPADYLAKMEQDDPEAYRSEVLGEFRAGVSRLFDPQALLDCVDRLCRERRPEPGNRYVGYLDSATGGGRDRLTFSIAHMEKRGGGDRKVAVLDLCRAWSPPFDPIALLEGEVADLAAKYKIAVIMGDAYASGAEGGFVSAALSKRGILYELAELDRTGIYLEALALVNSGGCLILNNDDLLLEMRGLERRRGPSGKDKVDHRPGSFDDRATSACGAMVQATRRSGKGFSLAWSVRESTTGERWENRGHGHEKTHDSRTTQVNMKHPSIHPHERDHDPLLSEKDMKIGPTRAERWRTAWGTKRPEAYEPAGRASHQLHEHVRTVQSPEPALPEQRDP